jgi:hypothetical protein
MRVRSLILSVSFLLALLALAGTPRPRAVNDESGEPTPPWECTIIAGELACIGGDDGGEVTPTPGPDEDCMIVAGELACTAPEARVIQGQIRRRDSGAPLAGVEVVLQGPTGITITATDLDGRYVFELPDAGGPWRIEPRGASGASASVSSLDAAYVAQSVVGARRLASEQSLACDVTGNGRLTSLDAAYIVRRVVGLNTQLPLARKCGSDFLFVPEPETVAGQSIIRPSAAGQCRMGAIVIDSVEEEAAGQDFEAMAIGDCTSTRQASPRFSAQLEAGEDGAVAFAGRLRRSSGGSLLLPLFIRSDAPVYALDAKLSYDPTRLRGTRARLVGTSRGIYYAFNGEYRPGVAALALASADALPLDDDGNFAISIYFEPLDGASGIAPIGLDVLVDEQPAETR